MRVHIWPDFSGEDKGEGGIRRVVEGQQRSLPDHGIDLTDSPADADVIAVHVQMPSSYVLRYPDKPMVAMCHGMYWAEYEWENWALNANTLVMEAIRIADIVTAPSEWVAQCIRRHTMRDVVVVPHGVDADEWEHRERIGDAVLARFTEAEILATDKLISGAPYVLWNKNRPDPICDPAPMNMLAVRLPEVEFVSTYGEAGANITLTGRQPFAVAKELIEAASVYLCTTRETFGVGTLEALAAGVPVVGWSWGGQVDIIEHGVDGWLVAPGDFEGLAKGIAWALSNRAILEDACRAKARRYTWARAGEAYAGVFHEAWLKRSGMPVQPPRTSIIVTAYKLDQYLADCLDSVAAQTDQDWECIVVDDASPDECGEIAEEYADADPRFRVIHNTTNQYLAGARNTGIGVARGRYILPLDADDMIAGATVEVLAGALDQQRAISVAYGGVLFVDEDGRTPTDYRVQGVSVGHSGWPVDFQHEWQLQAPRDGGGRPPNLLPYCSMFRREAWRQTAGYRTRVRTAEDADFWCRLSSYGFRPKKVTTTDTLIYRNREHSMSRDEGVFDWSKWFPWARNPKLTPAGAGTAKQLPVPSCDPPAIAVIIPLGPGHGPYLLEAIDSVEAQTFRQWECIVAIDDSSDDLPMLPSWVRVIDGRGGRGVARARNLAIAAAKARTFIPLDADDMLEPEALNLLWEEWKRTGDIVYPDFWEDPDTPGTFTHWNLPDYDPKVLITNGCVHTVTALTPVEAWHRIGGYDETLRAGWEDWAFQLRAAELCICTHRVALPLFTYRKWTGSRREEIQANFEEAREEIVSRFGDYWNGGKEMGGCGSCGGGSINPIVVGGGFGPEPDRSGAVLLKYIGPRDGAVPYTSRSGAQPYWFGKGDERYVLLSDMPIFAGNPDFAVLEAPAPRSVGVSSSGPELVSSAPAQAEAPTQVEENVPDLWSMPAQPITHPSSGDPPPESQGAPPTNDEAPSGLSLESLVPPAPLPDEETAVALHQTQDLPDVPGVEQPKAPPRRRAPAGPRGAAAGKAQG